MKNIKGININLVGCKPMIRRLAWNDGKIQPRTLKVGHKAREAIKKIKQKIVTGEYEFENVSCFCGSCDDMVISEIDRYGFYYPLAICKRCGLIRANPRMTKASYIKFYAEEYRNAYGESDSGVAKLFEYRINQGKQRYNYLVKHVDLPAKAVVFEVGCDFGTALLPFAEAGYDVYGCDYGVEHIEYGRKKTGLKNLFIGGLEKLIETNKKADIVVLHHVLEHFCDLEGELIAIRKIMKPRGLIYIAVPGTLWWINNICGADIMGLLQNAHTYQFSLGSLTYVMECCGFKLIHGNEKIDSFFKVDNVFRKKQLIPDMEFQRVVSYLKRMERKYLPKYYLIKCLEILGIKKMIKNMWQKRC